MFWGGWGGGGRQAPEGQSDTKTRRNSLSGVGNPSASMTPGDHQITALKLKSVLGGPGGRLQRGKVTPKAAGTASGGVGDPSASMTPAPDFSDHLFS